MRKALTAIFGVLLVSAVAAQVHDNAIEKKASDEVTISEALRAGDTMLPPGDYLVVCDRTKITFTRKLDGKRFELPCQGMLMEKKANLTKMVTNVDKSGVRYLDKLTLSGSNVEHVFK